MNEIDYFLIYRKYANDFELYAYTSIKSEKDVFMKFRNKDYFIIKKKPMAKKERVWLSDQCSTCRMKSFEFNISQTKVSIMLSYQEYLNIQVGITRMQVIMPSLAEVSPFIFKKGILDSLNILRYSEYYINNKGIAEIDIDEEPFMLLMRMNGDALNYKKILKEVI